MVILTISGAIALTVIGFGGLPAVVVAGVIIVGTVDACLRSLPIRHRAIDQRPV
jgi:hypothetical protein